MAENFYSKIKYFENIPAVPKRNLILTRLGYRNGVTELNENDRVLLEDSIRQGEYLCKPVGAYLIVPVLSISESCIILENGIRFDSNGLLKLLNNSRSVVLMAATVGKEVVDRISYEVSQGKAAAGLIIDSVASQTADAALDWMVQLLRKILVREGKILTKHRYSPGYGDLPLSYQEEIFKALQLDRLKMSLTEKFMLIPEKSVIAISGVEEKGEAV
ncbi:vitamin B12 dependent-methionine synthase activation domain-containing protein [Ruminiclostridium sufflavum]|uniref:vitamin B12 dependent-methionine synthase activation domain-containing protein n=1 Tax=Ruminiclostridium sufflavum TaxID=396504 RepID=UPI001FA84269|nr:vitamin B12 dependent-methionine synthase activation domain-containing protein [Ruminiclostridium sufflavum]